MDVATHDAAIFRALLSRANWDRYGVAVQKVLWLNTNMRHIYRHLADMYAQTDADQLALSDVHMYVSNTEAPLAQLIEAFAAAPQLDGAVLRASIRQATARGLAYQAANSIIENHQSPDFNPATAAATLQEAVEASANVSESQMVLDLHESGTPELTKDRPNLNSLGLGRRVDAMVGGGVAASEFCLILAGPKRGKTSLLSYIGTQAGLRGQRVLHFTLENPPQMAARRYDSALTGCDYSELLAAGPEVERQRSRIYDAGGFIKFINWQHQARSPSEIVPFVKELGADLLIVDYIQKMVPDGTKAYGRWEKRHLFDKLGIDMCRVLADLGIGMVSAWQTNREGDAADTVTEHDVSESWAILQHASTVIGMSGKKFERTLGRRRIHSILCRYADRPDSINYTVDLNRNTWREQT